MGRALPELPMVETVLVRLIRSAAAEMTDFFEPIFREIGLSESAFHVLCLLLHDLGRSDLRAGKPHRIPEVRALHMEWHPELL
jgi:hypothetical protein